MAKSKKQKTIKQIKSEHWGRVIRGIHLPLRFKPKLEILKRRKRIQAFLKIQPGLAATAPVQKTIRPIKPEKIQKTYTGFQTVARVTRCDQKRERRRRAYFGYLKSPYAGKGSKSPRSDRFTVKC